MTCLIKILISSGLLNQIGCFFFAEMQLISYFIILKHIQPDQFTILKDIEKC